MNERYSMFFDESQRTDILRIDECGKPNFVDNNEIQSFIGVFSGLPTSRVDKFNESFLSFESRQRKIFHLSDDKEIKSTMFDRSQFTFGFASLKKNNKGFYLDLFRTIQNENIIFTISSFNKIEYLLNFMIVNLDVGEELTNGFYYTLAKFLTLYGCPRFYELYPINPDDAIFVLVESMKKIIKADSSIERLSNRNAAYRKTINILENCNYDLRPLDEIPFAYIMVPDSLVLHLQELGIEPSEVDLFIDGEKNPLDCYDRFFESIKYVNSIDTPLIRVSDHIAGLFYKFIYHSKFNKNRKESKSDDSHEEKERKRLLYYKWFNLTEDSFNLYRLFFDAVLRNNDQYWSVMTSRYHDDVSYVIYLIRYFNEFASFDDYSKLSPEQHSDDFEKYACFWSDNTPDKPRNYLEILDDRRLF